MNPPLLEALLGRHSQGIRHLVEPGPDVAALALMTQAALRAPDHAGLVPFRFKAVVGSAREPLAQLFEAVARDAGKDEASVRIDGERARSAPVTVAVLARIDLGHPLVPSHEQWAALGGAVTNFLNAAHALGYAGKILSGAKARSPILAAAFCDPGETLVGWIALGTAARPVAARHAKPGAADVLTLWEPPA
jgi:nitroreductase